MTKKKPELPTEFFTSIPQVEQRLSMRARLIPRWPVVMGAMVVAAVLMCAVVAISLLSPEVDTSLLLALQLVAAVSLILTFVAFLARWAKRKHPDD